MRVEEYRTHALVLQVYDQRESDRLVHLYTEDLGRVSAIAKGARRSRKRFPGTLEILNVLQVRLVVSPRSSLMRLEEARVLQPFERFTNRLGRYAVACQLGELLKRFTGEHEPSPELFAFSLGVLDVVAEEEPDRLLALLVLAKTLARLGYRPQFAACARCGMPLARGTQVAFVPREGGVVCRRCGVEEEPRVPARLMLALEQGLRSPLRERGRLGLGREDVRRAERLLERFFRFHLASELRSAPFLRDILGFGPLEAKGPRGVATSCRDPLSSGPKNP